jgi:hypothetical protein
MGKQRDRDKERLWELLADQVVFGLTPQETRELDSLLASTLEGSLESLEQVAAGIALAGNPTRLPSLSPELRARIRSTADRCLRQAGRS